MMRLTGRSTESTRRRFRLALAFAGVMSALAVGVTAQIPGRNVNMVSGTTLPDGDPYLQRQNEPSIAASTRNPLHLLGGSNDYRTVDLPGLPGGQETGDAWLGLFKSTDGGQRWKSTLVPGYPQDSASHSIDPTSPLRGYQAAADPVVRAGTNGLFYYAGLVFNRTDEKSAIFVARFIDNNNVENGDPIAYLSTGIVASSPGTRFLDKPWMAVDIPRSGATCAIAAPRGGTQRIPAGAVYVSWTAITGTGSALRSQILLTRSLDCGVTWSAPTVLSRAQDQINQGSTIAIDPRSGAVIVAWRRFSTPGTTDGDALTVARSLDFGRKFEMPSEAHRFPKRNGKMTLPPWVFEHRGKDKDRDDADEDDRGKKTGQGGNLAFRPATPIDPLAAFDEPSGSDRFRTNGYPTMAIDDTGRVYIAWTERGFSTIPGRTSPVDGDAKIVMATSSNGAAWRAPQAVSDPSQPGHQFMPSLTFAGGKLLLIYYDLRDDVSQTLSRFADDTSARPSLHRRTMDIRASMAEPGALPIFAPSVKVSNYAIGSRPGSSVIEQMQYNPPNLPMFRLGTVPFVGDYIDLTPAPAFVPVGRGGWAFNTAGGSTLPVFQAVWTDNRDVRAPRDGNWTHYTPPFSAAHSPVNGAVCDPGFTASRNQNIYTSRITGGLLVGSPGNTKPLSPTLQRAFVVFAQNTSDSIKTFRLSIAAQPIGGRATFSQFTLPAQPLTSIDVATAPRSMAVRSVYVTSSDPLAQVTVDVHETASVGGSVLPTGLQASVLLNPDIQNPDIQNPAQNPVGNPDIQNGEVHNPDIQNPDIQNPDIQNPDIQNPDIQNPDIQNVVLANPDIQNPDIQNPDIQNPDIQNPDIQNPDIQNPDIQNGALTDVTWSMTNTGNTTTAYNVNLFLTSAQIPTGFRFQLVLHKTYTTPVSVDCELKSQTQNVLVANIRSPQFADSSTAHLLDQNDPSLTNPTLFLAPGEIGKITLRIIDPDRSNNVTTPDGLSVDPAFDPRQAVVTPILVAQPVGTPEAALGQTKPPIVTPNNSSILFLTQPASSIIGQPIGPAVRVQVRDAAGAIVPGVPVTLSLGANPGDASLSGGGAALTDVNGIATFNALSLDRIGTGYTLVASVGVAGIRPSTSTPFDVKFIPEVPLPALTQWKLADGGNNAFYKFVPTHITWTAAEAACVADGGHLASIHSLAENHFASGVIDPAGVGGITAFLGGSGSRSDGWFWQDGTPFVYSNWRTSTGEPSGGGNVIQMWPDNNGSNSGWNDVPDGVFSDIGYLCKFPPPPPTLIGPAGGFGGSPFAPVNCPAGSVVVGFAGRAGDDIDRTEIVCAPPPALTPTSPLFVAGGFGGNDYGSALTCGAGEAVTGVFGGVQNGNGWIDYLGVTCTNLATAASHHTGTVGLNQGGTPFTLSCPSGTTVTGVEGRQGALMDQISIRCQ